MVVAAPAALPSIKVKLIPARKVVEGETIDVSLCGLLVKAGRTLTRVHRARKYQLPLK